MMKQFTRPATSLLIALIAILLAIGGYGNADSLRAPYREGEAIVAFRPQATPEQIDAMLNAVGADILDNLGEDNLALIRLPEGRNAAAAVQALNTQAVVAFIEPNYLCYACPNDPFYPDLWGLNNKGQWGGKAGADINAEMAWALSTGNRNAVVFVIDTGIDYNHPDLRDNLFTDSDGSHGYNAITNSNDPMDDNGHGTHVSGTIGARGNNGMGVAGVNWSIRIGAAKFLDSNGGGSTADAIKALNYVADLKRRGVPIIATNNSWGGGGESIALKQAIERHNALGILFIAAASNEGSNNDRVPAYPASYDLPNVIAVAATDRNDRLAGFSNYGQKSVHIAAPGVDIISAFPGNQYIVASGTSMAAPHVTGAIALLHAYDPSLNYLQLKERLLATGDALAALKTKTISGRRLNLFRALRNETDRPPTLTVTVRANKASYYIGQTARIEGTVTNNGRPVRSATVNLVITKPNGRQAKARKTTNAQGEFSYDYKTAAKDGLGTLTVAADAAKRGIAPGSGSTTFTLAEPPPPKLRLRLDTDKEEYRFGGTVRISGRVTSEGDSISGARVEIAILKPNGSAQRLRRNTASDGNVAFSFKPRRSDGTGAYQVTGKASKKGYTPDDASVTFRVR